MIKGLLLFSYPGSVLPSNSSLAFLAASSDVKQTYPNPLDSSDSTNLLYFFVCKMNLSIFTDFTSPHF